MPTPKRGYFLKDGTKVPGVTTILSRFKSSGGLIHWAWNLGMQGLDYRDVRDSAASSGTLAHALVDADIHGLPCDTSAYPDEIRSKAEAAYGSYLEWKRQTNLKPVATEMQLVSEKYKYGGTPDAILAQDKLSLGDWKTGNVYPEMLIQLAAYKNLWEENFPDKPIVGGFHLLRFSKEHGDFTHHYWSELDLAWRAFVLMRELYDIDLQLKNRVG